MTENFPGGNTPEEPWERLLRSVFGADADEAMLAFEAVSAAAARLIAEIRAGSGPRLLHAITYRLKGHVSVDAATYRDAAEVESALKNDPIANARERLKAQGLGLEAERIEREARDEIAAAVATAAAAPPPNAEAAYADVITAGQGAWQ